MALAQILVSSLDCIQSQTLGKGYLRSSFYEYLMALKDRLGKARFYTKVAAFMVLMLVAGFFLLVSIFGIVEFLLTKNSTFLIGGIFSFFLFFVIGMISKRLEPAYRKFEESMQKGRKTTYEDLKENWLFLLIIPGIIAFSLVFESYFLQFPPAISGNLAQDMLKSVLTIDGIVIGFDGVILAQFLWAIHSKGNILYDLILKEDYDIQKLNSEVKGLNRKRIATIFVAFYSTLPILASIFYCFTNLALIDGKETVSPRDVMFQPLLWLCAGVMLLIISTMQTNLLPTTQEK